MFDEECRIILEDKKRAYSKVINRNTRQNEQYADKKKHIKYFDKKKFKSKLEQMEIAYNNNAKKKFIKRIVKKGFQTRNITHR